MKDFIFLLYWHILESGGVSFGGSLVMLANIYISLTQIDAFLYLETFYV